MVPKLRYIKGTGLFGIAGIHFALASTLIFLHYFFFFLLIQHVQWLGGKYCVFLCLQAFSFGVWVIYYLSQAKITQTILLWVEINIKLLSMIGLANLAAFSGGWFFSLNFYVTVIWVFQRKSEMIWNFCDFRCGKYMPW